MRKSPKLYFLPYGLTEGRVEVDELSDEVILTVNRPTVSQNPRTVPKTFRHYFLNWGGVFLVVFGITVGCIGYLQREINWETVDPDSVPDYALVSAGKIFSRF